MGGDLRIEVEHRGRIYNVDYEMESLDESVSDVKCPNCDGHNVVEHRIGLAEVEIHDSETMGVVDLSGLLGQELLVEATIIANKGREKPYTCDECQHSFH